MLRKVFIKPKLVPAKQQITGSFFLKTRRLILKLTNVPVFQFDVIFKVPSFHHVQTLETIFTGQIECLYRIMVNFDLHVSFLLYQYFGDNALVLEDKRPLNAKGYHCLSPIC